MNIENKQIKNKKVDKETTLKVYFNEAAQRIFVEFFTKDRKLVLQKNFQNNPQGIKDSEHFQESIQSTNDLRKYFGLSEIKGEENAK